MTQPQTHTLAAIVAAALIAGLLPACTPPVEDAWEARRGSIDLRSWRPALDGPVRLDGSWDFYWRQLVPPDQKAAGHPVPITVPRFWNRTKVVGADGRETTAGRGFATYRLRVRLPPDAPPLALRLVNVNTAVEVYAQGQLVWQVGRVATEARAARPAYRPGVALLPEIDGSQLELLVHTSNYGNTRGGLDDPVWLGTPGDLIAERTRALAVRGLLVGGLLIMGLYHFVLFALRRRSTVSLSFGFVCLCAVGRLAVTDELLVLELWPGLPWPILVKGMFFFGFSVIGTFASYLRALWPSSVPAPLVRGIEGFAAAAVLVVLATPVDFFTRGLVVLESFAVACVFIGCAVFARAVQRREHGRWIYAAGFVFLGAGTVYDVIVSQGLLAGGVYLGPVGFFVFLLSQSAILAQRFSHSLSTVERQRGELRALVDHLESERRERRKYEELSLAASGLAHETKNPLGIIRGLAQRLLSSPEAAPAARRQAGQILDQADRAASRLGDFLSYARLRDPVIAPVELESLLRYATEVLAPDLEAKRIPHRLVGVDVTVLADEEMLLQIVLNLLLNSIAASAPGDALELRFEKSEDGESGRLVISDEGAGIATEMLERVRKPYVSGRPGGHGLGLALVERLAELHAWELEIESTAGEGTRVRLEGIDRLPPTGRA